MAAQAGVAQSTVSRCFQDASTISPETRARVLAAAAQLGYVPNAMARSLITQRSNMVGVLATKYTMRGNPDLIYALGESLAAAGKSLLLVAVESDWPDAAALRGALEYPLDGLISCAMLEDAAVQRFADRGVSMVFYNRSILRPRIDCVGTDHGAGAAEVAERLYAAGSRRFLMLAGPASAPVSQERCRGFLERLANLGVHRTPILHADYSYNGGRAAFLAHAACGPAAVLPDAVFCANDQLALGALDACRFDLGLQVPRQLSIVGFDDVPEGARPAYELTTMHQDSVAMAGTAVALLLRRMRDPAAAARRLLVPARLVVRGSARLPGGPDSGCLNQND